MASSIKALGTFALALSFVAAQPERLSAQNQDYVLDSANFYNELCSFFERKIYMDWPGGVTDSTNNGVLTDPTMVMDRAVQYHFEGVPASLIQWQDPVWVPDIQRFKMGVSIVGEANIILGVVDPDNPNAIRGLVRVIPSMGMTGAEEVIVTDPQGPFPKPPATFGFRVQAGDGGNCPTRPFVDYRFRLVQ